MEIALAFLQRFLLIGIGVFALYQCFQIGDRGFLSRPVAGWIVRACLIVVAAVSFFTFAHLAGSH